MLDASAAPIRIGREKNMFTFNGTSAALMWVVWLGVFAALFAMNEISRRSRTAGFVCFVILPTVLTVCWFTFLRGNSYTDWFHLAKVYSSTAGCIGFWCIRHLEGTRKDGTKWKLSENKAALCFPPLILAINILEACTRDIEVGLTYKALTQILEPGTATTFYDLLGGPWNFMNATAGFLNIVTITGWFGICLRKRTERDGSRDMLWPDMMWFWIVAYDLWNFAYTYNCLPHHAWYCGFALLLAPTVCAFTVGKGAWLQHRAQTLALWCMFAQTFPAFQDNSMFRVNSTYKLAIYNAVSALALAANVAVFVFMLYKIKTTRRNPYASELYSDMKKYQEVKALAE